MINYSYLKAGHKGIRLVICTAILTACGGRSDTSSAPIKAEINPSKSVLLTTVSGGQPLILRTNPSHILPYDLLWTLEGPGSLAMIDRFSPNAINNTHYGMAIRYTPPEFGVSDTDTIAKVTVFHKKSTDKVGLLDQRNIASADAYTFEIKLNPKVDSSFSMPYGIAYDSVYNRLFVTDIKSGNLRIIDGKGVVTTADLKSVNRDGSLVGYKLVRPTGITVHPKTGNVFIAESNRNIVELSKVNKNDSSQWIVRTVWQEQDETILVENIFEDPKHSNARVEYNPHNRPAKTGYTIDGVALSITEQGDQKARLNFQLPGDNSLFSATLLSTLEDASYSYDVLSSSLTGNNATQYRPGLKIETSFPYYTYLVYEPYNNVNSFIGRIIPWSATISNVLTQNWWSSRAILNLAAGAGGPPFATIPTVALNNPTIQAYNNTGVHIGIGSSGNSWKSDLDIRIHSAMIKRKDEKALRYVFSRAFGQITFDQDGHLYLADTMNNRIAKLSQNDEGIWQMSVIAGGGSGQWSSFRVCGR
ncbi:hypothetical protein [Fastidiosibacter lacustris]|uniref:hypothetical protein n=1 Tax=Fastidiosibacter lacustris TaxID=2056695 RepID=UPI000E34A5BF|nr:hypothetical protein [Fastidiosibacter lacustris]